MKKLLFLTLLWFGIVFVISSCKYNPFSSNTKKYIFSYTAFDSTEVKVVMGVMNLTVDDKQHVSGNWIFEQIKKDFQAGPQNGNGKLEGNIDKGVLYINLNPDFVDNNVFLTADWNDKKLEGKWQYVGFPGVLNEGRFVAVSLN